MLKRAQQMESKAGDDNIDLRTKAQKIAEREPKSELDELKERFLGLLLVKDGESAPSGEEEKQNQTFVLEKDLPTVSRSACHVCQPYRAKRINYRLNRAGEITDIVFG